MNYRILCCVGLKNDNSSVLKQAVKLAIATDSELDILHAVKSLSDDIANTLRDSIPDQDVLESLSERRLKEANESLDKQIKDFWANHPDLQTEFGDQKTTQSVLEGYPASVIARFAQKTGSDMIVISANKRAVYTSYAGKITKGVIKRARVPVVVVPSGSD